MRQPYAEPLTWRAAQARHALRSTSAIHLRRELLRRSRPVEHDVCRRGALLIGCLRGNPCHSVGPRHAARLDKPLHAHVLRRRNGDDHVKVAALAGLDEQRDVVNDDVHAVGRVPGDPRRCPAAIT